MTSHCLATGSFLVISHKIMKCILILNKYPSVLLFSLASFILLSFSSSLLLPWHASLLLLIVLNSDLPSWPQHLSSISPLLLPCPFKEWAYRLPSFLPGCWVMSENHMLLGGTDVCMILDEQSHFERDTWCVSLDTLLVMEVWHEQCSSACFSIEILSLNSALTHFSALSLNSAFIIY